MDDAQITSGFSVEQPPPPSSLARALHTIDALLVEDDDIDAEIIETVVQGSGEFDVQFTRARSLTEARRCLQDKQFDLYFIDFRLKDEISLNLLTSLDKIGVCTIVLSNISRHEADKLRLNTGKLRFMSKTEFRPGAINAVLRNALNA